MNVPPDCVWLFPSGMAAIYAAHRAVTALRPGARSVQYGFPYVDTLKIQQDLGPGAIFLPFGNEAELPALADALAAQPVSAIFCEFPSNPLLGSPPLQAVSDLAARHAVPVVVDDTISTYANVNPLPACDLLVTSLTKFFTGRGDVMAGAVVLNPQRPLAGPFAPPWSRNTRTPCGAGTPWSWTPTRWTSWSACRRPMPPRPP
jgi:cystathionine gamma-synthase